MSKPEVYCSRCGSPLIISDHPQLFLIGRCSFVTCNSVFQLIELAEGIAVIEFNLVPDLIDWAFRDPYQFDRISWVDHR